MTPLNRESIAIALALAVLLITFIHPLTAVLISVAGMLAFAMLTDSPDSSVPSYFAHQAAAKRINTERVLDLLREKGEISNADVQRHLGVSDSSAQRYLDELEKEGVVSQIGERGRWVRYKVRG